MTVKIGDMVRITDSQCGAPVGSVVPVLAISLDDIDYSFRGDTYYSSHGCYEPLIAEAASSEARVNPWSPIETAPKDGREFLGWSEKGGWGILRRELGEWVTDWGTPRCPTHWQPLTAPTEEKGND